MRKFWSDEDGQAILEYLLMLSVALSILIILSTGMRRSILVLWRYLYRRTAAACPSCPFPES